MSRARVAPAVAASPSPAAVGALLQPAAQPAEEGLHHRLHLHGRPRPGPTTPKSWWWRSPRAVPTSSSWAFPIQIPWPTAPPTRLPASARAQGRATTVQGVLDTDAAHPRTASPGSPILFFTYLQSHPRLRHRALATGAWSPPGSMASLPLDLPLMGIRSLLATLRPGGPRPTAAVANALAAPTTPSSRKTLLARCSHGFLYYVCRLVVTGEAHDPCLEDLRRGEVLGCAGTPRRRSASLRHLDPEQAALAASWGDGVIVGSHLVRLIESHASSSRETLVAAVCARARVLGDAVHGTT